MSVNNGVMTMAPLPNGVTIPAGGTVAFKPGSYHVMFVDLKHPLKQGDHVKAKLTFERAGSVDVDFHIEAMGATGTPEHAHSMEGMTH
jgi:copper(I)-binding protein